MSKGDQIRLLSSVGSDERTHKEKLPFQIQGHGDFCLVGYISKRETKLAFGMDRNNEKDSPKSVAVHRYKIHTPRSIARSGQPRGGVGRRFIGTKATRHLLWHRRHVHLSPGTEDGVF